MVVRTCVCLLELRGGITAAVHRNNIREPIGRPYAGAIGDAFITHSRTVRVSMTFLDDECISVISTDA